MRMSISATERMALSKDKSNFTGQGLRSCLQGLLQGGKAVTTSELEELMR